MAGFPSLKKGNQLGEKAKRPKPGIPLDPKVIGELIVRCGGNLSRVADSIGSTRGVVRGVVDRNPELKSLLEDCRERQLDELEDAVWQDAIESKEPAMRCFLLKTRGKHRGYEQSEAQNTAKDIATAAFDFIVNKSKNPAEPSK